MIPITRAIPQRIESGLRRCAIQIDVYLTLLMNVTAKGVYIEYIEQQSRTQYSWRLPRDICYGEVTGKLV